MIVTAPDIAYPLHGYGITFRLCGSRVTCNPPPTNTDIDWLVTVPSHIEFKTYSDILMGDGWSLESLKGTIYPNDDNKFFYVLAQE